jgi:hypothetical protein
MGFGRYIDERDVPPEGSGQRRRDMRVVIDSQVSVDMPLISISATSSA